MLIAALALSAHAAPRAEALAGWSANGSQSFGYVTLQPGIIRTDTGRLVLRGTVSQARSSWLEGDVVGRLDAPGASFGPAIVFTPPDLSVMVGLSVGARRSSTWVGDTLTDSRVGLDASLSGEAFWRPGQRAQLYTQASLGVGGTLWARAGALYPVTPRDRDVSLWLGLEGTSAGPFASVTTEVGPVVEVPLRPLKASIGLRASAPVRDLAAGSFALDRTTLGVSGYWSL